MLWFSSKKDEMISQLVSQLSDAQLDLNVERQKRISAEGIAAANLARAEKAEEYGVRAENSRDEAVKMRAESLNLVNGKLLEHIAPEGPTPDPKTFRSLLGKGQNNVPPTRKRFKDAQIAAMRQKPKPTLLEPKLNAEGKPTLGLREGVEALDIDSLIQ